MILLSHTQLGCPFEPRYWDLQSTRLGCRCGNSYLIGLSPIPLDEFSTNSLANPLVSGSAMLSLDLTYSMEIIPIATPVFSHSMFVSGLRFRRFYLCVMVVVVLYFLIWSYRMCWAGLEQVG